MDLGGRLGGRNEGKSVGAFYVRTALLGTGF